MELQLEYPATPEGAPQHAQMAVEAAQNISQLNLDYSPESLAQVDQIIDSLRADGISPLQVGESLFAFGCYVGEVFVRQNQAKWRLAAETVMKETSGFPLVVEVVPGKFCNPIGKVFKRLISPEVEDLVTFYQKFSQPNITESHVEEAPKGEKKGLWKRLFGG